MRVCFVDHTSQPGGGELALVELILHLDKTTIEPVVVLFSDGPICEMLRGVVELHVLRMSSAVLSTRKGSLGLGILLKAGALFSIVPFVWRLSRLLRQLRVDLVHTNSLKSDVIGGLAGRLSGLRVLWHVRDRIAPDYLPGPAVKVFRWLARVMPDQIVANSQSTLDSLNLKRLWANGDDAPKAVVVYDGVDLERFQAIARPPIGGPQRVGLIGRISPWKGQDIFLRAAARTIRQFPDARFLVIGSVLFGEESFKRDIRRLCDELGINDRVEFTGFQKDVRERLAELDIVVHASTLPEPFGQVIIEAMAAERPVIATKGGGVPEIVVDQVTGLLVPMRDVDRMADAICRLLSDAELRAEMASCGRDRVRQLFTIQQTADNILRVYEGMLSPQLQMRPLADASVGAEIR